MVGLDKMPPLHETIMQTIYQTSECGNEKKVCQIWLGNKVGSNCFKTNKYLPQKRQARHCESLRMCSELEVAKKEDSLLPANDIHPVKLVRFSKLRAKISSFEMEQLCYALSSDYVQCASQANKEEEGRVIVTSKWYPSSQTRTILKVTSQHIFIRNGGAALLFAQMKWNVSTARCNTNASNQPRTTLSTIGNELRNEPCCWFHAPLDQWTFSNSSQTDAIQRMFPTAREATAKKMSCTF